MTEELEKCDKCGSSILKCNVCYRDVLIEKANYRNEDLNKVVVICNSCIKLFDICKDVEMIKSTVYDLKSQTKRQKDINYNIEKAINYLFVMISILFVWSAAICGVILSL